MNFNLGNYSSQLQDPALQQYMQQQGGQPPQAQPAPMAPPPAAPPPQAAAPTAAPAAVAPVQATDTEVPGQAQQSNQVSAKGNNEADKSSTLGDVMSIFKMVMGGM